MNLYFDQEEQRKRRIAFLHCEDDTCGFLLEFSYPNCTFFFCKEDRKAVSVDLNAVGATGLGCSQHGKMERYDVLKEDNICPSCEKSTLAILSVPR